MTARTLVAAAMSAFLALTISADAVLPDLTRAPRVEGAASAPEHFADWTGSLEEAKSLLAEFPGGDEVSVITAERAAAPGQQRKTAASVFWAAPSVIVVSKSWVERLYGPGSREVLRSVMLHEYTHVLAMTDLSEGGSLPEELMLSESDRRWAGGALAHTDSAQGAALEAIASCVQEAAYRADRPLLVSPASLTLPVWLAGDHGTYLTDPLGCPPAYTEAAFSYLQEVGDVDLRPSQRLVP